MLMDEFTNAIIAGLKKNGIAATPVENQKNNGVVLQGLTLRRNDERVAPVFYLNQFFEKFRSGELTENDILDHIIIEYEKLPAPTIPDLEKMMSSSDFIDRITLRMVNEERNRDMIESRNLVNYRLPDTDLVVLFYANVYTEDNCSGSMAITEDIFNQYLSQIKDAEELFNVISKRKDDREVKFEPITTILERLLAKRALPLPIIPDDYLYVLTNEHMTYGAGAILTEEAKKAVSERFPNGEVTVIPSSVHECILLETQPEEDLDVLRKMVYEVNRTEVSEEEYLSDEVYHYDAHTGKLTIAKEE